MTAAGTVTPAKVFVLGAGVAGLQAIATARRLGAVVHAYDVRPAVKEQVESVGAKFVMLDVDAQASEDKGGYAKAMDEAFYRRQRELMTETAARAGCGHHHGGGSGPQVANPDHSRDGSGDAAGIGDCRYRRGAGGNCELTRPGETVVHNGVTILGR